MNDSHGKSATLEQFLYFSTSSSSFFSLDSIGIIMSKASLFANATTHNDNKIQKSNFYGTHCQVAELPFIFSSDVVHYIHSGLKRIYIKKKNSNNTVYRLYAWNVLNTFLPPARASHQPRFTCSLLCATFKIQKTKKKKINCQQWQYNSTKQYGGI